MKPKRLPIYARTRAVNSSTQAIQQVSMQASIMLDTQSVPLASQTYRLKTLAGRQDWVWHASSLRAGQSVALPVWRSGFRDGPAHRALFNKPTGLAVDRRGYVYVADSLNHVIRRISPRGRVSTWAGSGERGLRDGLSKHALFNHPTGLTMGLNQHLYVVDQGNQIVRMLKPNGQVGSLLLEARPLGGIASCTSGYVYVFVARSDERCTLLRLDPQSGQNSLLAHWEGQWQWIPYRQGEEEQPFSRWSAQHAPHCLEIGPESLTEGLGLACSPQNELIWLSANKRWVLQLGEKPTLNSNALRLGWAGAHWQGLSINAEGECLALDQRHHRLYRISPEGHIEALLPDQDPLNQPYAVTQDAYGQLYISDTGHWRVCRIIPPGRELYARLAQLAFLPYYAPKGIQTLVERSLRRRIPTSPVSALPSPVIAEQYVLDVLNQGKRSQQLACVKELMDQLRHPTLPHQDLSPARQVLSALLSHSDTSIRTLLIRHLCETIQTEQNALFWIELLEAHTEPNRLLKKYLIEVLAWIGRRFELYGHVVPLMVEYIRSPEEDVVEYVFEHLLQIRKAGYASLIDPLIEDFSAS